jgi:TolA-binding protein
LDASTEESGFGAFLDGVANHRPLRGASAVADFSSFTHLPEVVHAEEAPLPAVNQVAESPELRMLIEHLNMVRQENREILRLSEESIRRITSMSETIVASKENVIAEREEELKRLREQLDQRDRDVVRLQQNIEDLEMLARTLE